MFDNYVSIPDNLSDPSVKATRRREIHRAIPKVDTSYQQHHEVSNAQANLAKVVSKLSKRYQMVKHQISIYNEYRSKKYEAEHVLNEALKRAISADKLHYV